MTPLLFMVAGAAVLVRSAATIVPVQYRGATVSDVDHGGADDRPSLDVIYDDDSEDGEDEENGVGTERVVTLSMSPCVSCAARLNLGRCYFKEARHPEVRHTRQSGGPSGGSRLSPYSEYNAGVHCKD